MSALRGGARRPVTARRRLGRLRAPSAGRSRDLAPVGAILAAVATVVTVGGWWGLALAIPVGVVANRILRRVEPPAERERRQREEADLPICADLIAAAIRAGAPVDVAVAAVV